MELGANNMLLEVRDLRVSYGNIEVLHGISLDVAPGEIVALLGANGAGKTTTLRTISGLLRPRAGSIGFEGQEIVGLPSHRIVALGIGHVPEGRRIFGGLTVEENLRLGGYLLRRDAAALDQGIEQAYETFSRLRERKDQLAGTLSGGEQQMLAIARALMLKPRLVLLDEPSMGLAPKLVRAIFEVIARISSAGTRACGAFGRGRRTGARQPRARHVSWRQRGADLAHPLTFAGTNARTAGLPGARCRARAAVASSCRAR
jgi:branched-chain amino acid transport system ATP-binding protein